MTAAQDKFTIRTGAGIKICALIGRNQNHSMSSRSPWERHRLKRNLPIRLASREVTGNSRLDGEPALRYFCAGIRRRLAGDAAEIGARPHFKDGINVELVIVKDKSNVEARFFERGVGETQSSGTGSCASAVAAICRETGRVTGAGSCAGRNSDGALGRAGFSSWSGATHLPGRISGLDLQFFANPSTKTNGI